MPVLYTAGGVRPPHLHFNQIIIFEVLNSYRFLDPAKGLFNFLVEELINTCLDSSERENDGEIPNQQWKPAKESEKGKP